MQNVSNWQPEHTNPHGETAHRSDETQDRCPEPNMPIPHSQYRFIGFYEGRLGSIVSSGPLFDICMAVNRAIRTSRGQTNFCVLAAAAARDILLAKGWKADVLRVAASVMPNDPSAHGVSVGSDGDGTRRPAAGPGKWWGHLVAIAEGKWIVDPTLDQTDISPPMVIEFPDWWLAGRQSIFVPIPEGEVRYKAFPGRGGYKSAPDFRPCRRRGIVQSVINELGAGGGPVDWFTVGSPLVTLDTGPHS
jgi:hypothetical protein